MKAERSQLIPRKLVTSLELLIARKAWFQIIFNENMIITDTLEKAQKTLSCHLVLLVGT